MDVLSKVRLTYFPAHREGPYEGTVISITRTLLFPQKVETTHLTVRFADHEDRDLRLVGGNWYSVTDEDVFTPVTVEVLS